MSQSTSASLLDRVCHAGDDHAWRRLLDLYTPLLSSWLSRFGLQPFDRDDLEQEILSVIVAKLSSFHHNGRPGAFRAWLRQITLNLFRRFQRDRQYAMPVADEDALQQREDSTCDLVESWNREYDERVLGVLLRQVASSVQDATWAAFDQHVLQGRSASEVATTLGLSVNAVLIAKSRVLRRLREAAGQLLD